MEKVHNTVFLFWNRVHSYGTLLECLSILKIWSAINICTKTGKRITTIYRRYFLENKAWIAFSEAVVFK